MIQVDELHKILRAGFEEGGWVIDPLAEERLVNYIQLLYKWNAVHNLTSVRDPKEMATRHILDSLVLLPFVTQGRVLDIGTGAGLPGIPLAVTRPDLSLVLLDSNQKKVSFVQHVIHSLKLTNVTVICARVEVYQPESPFDWVVSRAFASLAEFIELSKHLCRSNGRWIAMKGDVKPEELAALSKNYTLEQVKSVSVPGLAAKRTLVLVKKNEEGISECSIKS